MPDDNLFLPVPAVLPPTEATRTQGGGASAFFNPAPLIERAIRLTAEREGISVEEVVRMLNEHAAEQREAESAD